MNNWLKIGMVSIITAAGLVNSQAILAQSLGMKAEIAKYSRDYIPEFTSSIVSQSGNPKLGQIAVNIDF